MNPGHFRFVATISCNASVAGLGSFLLPIAVGALAQDGMDGETIGMIGFLELAFAAFTAMAVAWRVANANHIVICIIGALLAAVGNLISVFGASSIPALLVSRPIAGVGAGLMTCGGLAIIARLQNPERMYGYVGIAPICTAILVYILAPQLIESVGTSAFYGFPTALALINGVVLFSGRAQIKSYVERAHAARMDVRMRPQREIPGLRSNNDLRNVSLALVISFFLGMSDLVVGSFAAPIGAKIGVTLEDLGLVLTGSFVVAAFGCLLAARLGASRGFFWPLVLGQAGMVGLGMLIVMTDSPVIYTLAICGRLFSLQFLVPMYQGLYARLDGLGRIVAASAGANSIGYAVAPLVGGHFALIDQGQFIGLGVVASCASIVCVLVTILLIYSHSRTSHSPALANKTGLPPAILRQHD